MNSLAPARPLVSIIDDDEFVRAATSSLVRAFGWDAECFASAEDFLAAEAEMPQASACLVCDIQMPAMDGVRLLGVLQAKGWAVPTLFITALASPAVHQRALGQGALCVLEKPIDADELENWLRQAIGRG